MAPIPTYEQCQQLVIQPGRPFELEDAVINGYPTPTFKNLAKTFRTLFLNSFQQYGKREFISAPEGSGRVRATYRQVHDRALEVAAWMRERGIKVGTRVAIGGGNSLGWVVVWVACHLIGAVPVALNAWLPLDVQEHCLGLAKPQLVFVDGERAEMLAPAKQRFASKGFGDIFCWDAKDHMPESVRGVIPSLVDVVHPSKSAIDSVKKGEKLEGLGPESDAVIFYSSGTSGLPKAVLSSQRAALSGYFSNLYSFTIAGLRAGVPLPQPTDPQKVFMVSVPLFHVTGNLSTLSRCFHSGMKVVFHRRWNVKEAIELIKSEGVTHVGGVPAIVEGLLQDSAMFNNSTIEGVSYGGAPANKGLPKEIVSKWTSAGAAQGYGLTETNAGICALAGVDYVNKPESVGPPSPVNKIKIVDPATFKELPQGHIGLIMTYGVQNMKRYEGNEAATREAIKDGWFNTGDIGCVDADGFLYIKDRLKDIIIRGGENITSVDVENAVYTHPSVSEVAVMGVPDRILGEKVGVMLVLRPDHKGDVTEAELIEHTRSILPRHSVPSIIYISPEPLPRNVNGKVVKKDLKKVLVEEWERRGRLDGAKVRAKL